MNGPLLTIDIAHPPRHPDIVERELLDAWSKVRNSSSLRILKIIHGHGSSGKGGSSKDLVRNWAFRNRTKFLAVINGEDYGVYERATQEMRRDAGQYADGDLGKANAGVTVVWVK
jgi:hypothetical protein